MRDPLADDDPLLQRFRRHYHGRHAPEDAYCWLTDPMRPGPSGALSPQSILLRTADELDDGDPPFDLSVVYAAALEISIFDRAVTVEALRAARAELHGR